MVRESAQRPQALLRVLHPRSRLHFSASKSNTSCTGAAVVNLGGMRIQQHNHHLSDERRSNDSTRLSARPPCGLVITPAPSCLCNLCRPTAMLPHPLPTDAGARTSVKAARSGAQSKAERLNAAKQQREKKRAAALEARRTAGPPRIVALLPLSEDVDVPRLWGGLLAAFNGDDAAASVAGDKAAGRGMELDAVPSSAVAAVALPLAMMTLSAPERRRLRFTLLPPPEARDDPLAIVELGRCAEVVVLALPGDVNTVTIDDAGSGALAILRALGLPAVTALVQCPAASEGKNPLKERAAAKKHAVNALQEQVGSSVALSLGLPALDRK